MAELKTKKTAVSPEKFIAAVKPESRREDALKVLKLMGRVTGLKPRMWGPSIVGFGEYRYVYDSGHEGDMCLIGFSPRKASLVLYLMLGAGRYDALLAKLGNHKAGKGCLYINKLEDVDMAVLTKLIEQAFAAAKKRK